MFGTGKRINYSKNMTFTEGSNRGLIPLTWHCEDGICYEFSLPELTSLVSSDAGRSVAMMNRANRGGGE